MNFKSWAPLGAIALAIASMTSAHAADKSVAVTAIVEHPALDAVRDGVQAALKDAASKRSPTAHREAETAKAHRG